MSRCPDPIAKSDPRMRQASLPTVAIALAASMLLGACATGQVVSDDVPIPPRDGDADRGDADVTCPDACPSGQVCIGGRCVTSSCTGGCPSGETCCGSVCVNTRSDMENCGTCGTVCTPQGDNCLAGTCSCNGAAACSSGRGCCPGLGCIDTMGDPAHCGSCTTTCETGVECLAGACGGSCATGCPDVPHGHTACAGETCAISECDDGWADVDGTVGNGCECEVTPEPTGGETCDTAIDLGSISDAGETVRAEGTIIPATDADWFKFTATDDVDTTCDELYVDVRFETNPEDQFAFEVFEGDCSTNVCPGDVLFTHATDSAFPPVDGEPRGECPCSTTNTAGQNLCSDSTKTFYIRVRRISTTGGGTCDGYGLIITNGVRSTASP